MFSLKEKIKMKSVFEKIWKNIVDVIHEIFTRKYYIVRISQSKRGHIYLIIRKKKSTAIVRVKRSTPQKNLQYRWQYFFPGVVRDIDN